MNEIATSIKINMPIAPAIGISCRDKLQLSVAKLFRQNNYAPVWKSRSNRLDYRWRRHSHQQFAYVNSIAHQIGTSVNLPALLDFDDDALASADPPLAVISTWYPNRYLHWQLTPRAIDTWLNYLDDRRDNISSVAVGGNDGNLSPEIVLYARQRCHAYLNIALDRGISSDRARAGIYLDLASDSRDGRLIFTHAAELDLIATYIDFRDILAGANQQNSIERATIDLARSWLEFYRHCRIIGIDLPLARARAALTARIWYALDLALASYWGIAAPMEF